MRRFLAFLFTIVFIFGVVGSVSAVPIKWGTNGHYYEAISASNITWSQADVAAESSTFQGVNGHLATITSAEENSFIFIELGIYNNPYWLGGFQPDELPEPPYDVGWQWVTGETWNYTNWNSGEPNDGNSVERTEDALAFAWYDEDGTWNDAPAIYPYGNGGYVVEYEPIPEPATMLLLGTGLIGLAGARRKFKK
jgi:hypothetical protein